MKITSNEQQNNTSVENNPPEVSERVVRQLAEIFYRQAMDQFKREDRLKKEPKGFHLDVNDYYTCPICGRTFSGDQLWFDKLGFKCMDCQRAVDDKLLPKFLFDCKHRAKWVKDYAIKDTYNIHPATKMKLIRTGKLKAIELKDENNIVYERVYILKENPLLK